MRWAGRSAPIIATSSTPVRMPDVPLPDVIAAVISPAPPRGTVTVHAYPSYVLRPGSGVGLWAGYPEMFPVATAGHRTTAGVTFEVSLRALASANTALASLGGQASRLR